MFNVSEEKTIRTLIALLHAPEERAHLRSVARERGPARLKLVAEWVLEYQRGDEGRRAERRYFRAVTARDGFTVAHHAARARRAALAHPLVAAVLVPLYDRERLVDEHAFALDLIGRSRFRQALRNAA